MTRSDVLSSSSLDPEARGLPRGLSGPEYAWLAERAAQAGGLTAAFHHLVRTVIVLDAVTATSLARTRLIEAARRADPPPVDAEQRVEAWCATRAASACGVRLLNLLGWRRPGTPGGYGQAPEDDPAHPLPRATLRRLIAEGRTAAAWDTLAPGQRSALAAAIVGGRNFRHRQARTVEAALDLHGLRPEERRWLARLARAQGGFEPALRLLVRLGRGCEQAMLEWEHETRPRDDAADAVYVSCQGRGEK